MDQPSRNSHFPKARQRGLITRDVDDELLVFDVDSNTAHCLNPLARAIWINADGAHSPADLVGILRVRLGLDVESDAVWQTLSELHRDGLLEEPFDLPTDAMSRGDLFRRAGLVGLAAVPAVTTLALGSGIAFATTASAGSPCSQIGTACTGAIATTCSTASGTPTGCSTVRCCTTSTANGSCTTQGNDCKCCTGTCIKAGSNLHC